MKRPIKYFLVLIILIISLFNSCIEDIELGKNIGEEKVALSCILNNSDRQTLSLTWSKPIKGKSGWHHNEVEEATIRLYEEGTDVGRFSKSGYGAWSLSFRPTPGKEYSIEADVPGYPHTIRAKTSMPKEGKITEPKSGTAVLMERSTAIYVCREATNPYWIFSLKSSLTDLKYLTNRPKVEQDPDIKMIYPAIGTSHKDADRFNQSGNSIEFTKYGTTPAYKQYIRVIPNPEISSQKPYQFSVQIPGRDFSFIVFRYASAEYDNYLKSIIEKKSFYENEYDFSYIFDEQEIFSNIENGLGIFGAYYQSSYFYFQAEYHSPKS